MIPYTKPICKISPVSVGESKLYVGRIVVSLRVDFGDGKSEIIALMLPSERKGEKSGDSITVSHQLFLKVEDGQDVADTFDHVLRTVGFRPESEKVQ